jgi:hypothetical protein
VDRNLFPNANLDNRRGALTNSTARVFVVGKRMSERAADGRVYSRALQANSTYYYSIACKGVSASGSFRTANIPLGMTYSDLPQVDTANPGQTMLPTLPEKRNSSVIDPLTGALIKRVTTKSDGIKHPFMQDNGSIRQCGSYLIGPGPGFLCQFAGQRGSPAGLYYVIPATGEVRFLGILKYDSDRMEEIRNGVVSRPLLDQGHPGIVYALGTDSSNTLKVLIKGTYSGHFNSVSGNAVAPVTWKNLTPPPQDLGAIVRAYDPTLEIKTARNCTLNIGKQYGTLTCLYGIQNSYGWEVAFDLGNRQAAGSCSSGDNGCVRVIGESKPWQAPGMRWCGIHADELHPSQPVVHVTGQEMAGIKGAGGTAGNGPYLSTLTQDVGTGDTVLNVSGEPMNAGAPDAYLMDAQVGDTFKFMDTGELVQITAKNSPTSWTVKRALFGLIHAAAHPSGTALRASCQQTQTPSSQLYETYWTFASDPAGTDYVIDTLAPSGHEDWNDSFRGSYLGVVGPTLSSFNTAPSFSMTFSPQFAGADAFAEGNVLTRHPSIHQDPKLAPRSEQTWFSDMTPFAGGVGVKTPASLVAGQLYKYQTGTTAQTGKINRKQMATLAVSGGHPLVDISGPGSQLSGDPVDSYKYCVAYQAGECYSGSNAGDVFVNVPNLKVLTCRGGVTPNPAVDDICVLNMPMQAQGVLQIGFTSNGVGLPSGAITNVTFRAARVPVYGAGYSRVVTQGLAGVRNAFTYPTAKPLPDASWMLFSLTDQTSSNTSLNDSILMAQLPPTPTPDGVDRSTFVPATLNLTPPAGSGAVSAVVRFGYAEQGGADQYLCSSRREACVRVSTDIRNESPFSYEKSDNYSLVACSSSCTVTIPVLPMHTAYFRASYLDGNGNEVGSDVGVAIESTTTIAK